MSGPDSPHIARIALVDDHPSVLLGVAGTLQQTRPGRVAVTTWTALRTLLDAAEGQDLVILDVQLGDGSAPEDNVAACVRRGWPVLLYTMEANPAILRRCFRAGARGIVGKHESMDQLVEGASRVLAGEAQLSPAWARALEGADDIPDLSAREAEALTLYARGLPLKSVARRMGIMPDTAKDYLLRVRRKYELAGRPAPTKSELTVRAIQDGFIGLGPGGVTARDEQGDRG